MRMIDSRPRSCVRCRREDRTPELLGKRCEDSRVAHDALVAAAVKEQRRSLAVADVLDLARKSGDRRPSSSEPPGDELGECGLDERVSRDDLGKRVRVVVPRPACEPVGESGLALLEDADAEVRSFAEQRVQLGPPVDRDQDERWRSDTT